MMVLLIISRHVLLRIYEYIIIIQIIIENMDDVF
jgi:hypothetical protein